MSRKTMNPPNLTTSVTYPETNITYQILAYRQLTPAEAKTSIVGFYRLLKKNRRPKNGETVTITTAIGRS